MGAPKLINPADNAAAVTPADDGSIDPPTRALYIGGAGDVKVDMVGTGTAVIFAGLAAGTMLPIRVTRVYDADTNATSIVALY